MDSAASDGIEAGRLHALRVESLSALAAGITHDLANTFASVNMALDLLAPGVREKDRWILSSLETSVHRGMEAVRQILFLASAREEEPLIYQAVHLMRDVQKLLRDALPPAIALASEHLDEVCLVRGEPLVLRQLLLTLGLQAASDLPLGGELTLRAASATLDTVYCAQQPCARQGLHLRVDVESRGTASLAGAEPRSQPAAPPPALLAALDREGGFLEARRPDARTMVTSVFLPGLPPAEPAGAPADGAPCGVAPCGVAPCGVAPCGVAPCDQGRGEAVLVVEPHSTLREALTAVLDRHGWRALATADAAQGLARLAQSAGPFGAVLFAARSLLRDGCGALRAASLLCPAATILVTGDRLTLSAIPQPGAPVSTLESPFTAAQLLQALARPAEEARP
jgi:CheY-like chemotaxis protein